MKKDYKFFTSTQSLKDIIPAVFTYLNNFIEGNESKELFEYLNKMSIYKQVRGRYTK